MNGTRLAKIALCFFLLEGAMGAGMLPAGADDTARPASQTADDSRPDNGGPTVKAVTIQGRSRKMIIKKAPTEKEIREREKAIDNLQIKLSIVEIGPRTFPFHLDSIDI